MARQTRMQIVNAVKTISKAMNTLVQFKSLYITIMIGSLIYLTANYPTIGISQDVVFIYAILSLFGMVWADQQKISLDILNWRASSPIGGKIIKTPERTYLIILYSIMAAIFTAFIIIIAEGITPDLTLDSAAKMELALQQLFVVTLTETVLFVGIIPMVLMAILFQRRDGGASASASEWGVVYVLTGIGFALMHNFVYGGDMISMLRVGFLGMLWLWMGRHISLGVAWGSHFGFNMAVLGLITFGGM